MEIDAMWIWWTATVVICGWKIVEGFARPYRMLEWPFLACLMWAYFYGDMAYEAKTGLSEYLGNDIADLGQLMPLLCLIGILLGWNLGTQIIERRPLAKPSYPYFRLWLVGFFLLIVGAAGGYSVMVASESDSFTFEGISGYWYLIFLVGYPGLTLAVWTLYKMDSPYRKYLWIITLIGLVAFMFPHMVRARRGPLFPAMMILLLVPPMARRRPPNPLLFCSVLAAVGLLMLVFLQVRHVTYNGGTWTEALQQLDVNDAIEDKVTKPEDNEYINNCQLIGTLYQDGKYQYGTGYLGLLLHWIPRAVWKDKPTLGEGSYSFEEMFDDVEKATGFRLLGTGAAAGGVADTFVQFGLLCPLVWFGLSWGIGKVYVRARNGDDPRWLFSYVGIICATHWLVSQGVAAAFVPAMYFQAVPLAIFFVPIQQTNERAGARKMTRRRPNSPVPKQPLAP